MKKSALKLTLLGLIIGFSAAQFSVKAQAVSSFTKESDAFSADLKARGMSFVGSTIIYSHMQAVGMVNDHLVDCFRYKEVQRLARS